MGNTNSLSRAAIECAKEGCFSDCGTVDTYSNTSEEEVIINEDIEELIMMRNKYDEYSIDLSTILEEGGGDNSTVATMETIETVRRNLEKAEQRDEPSTTSKSEQHDDSELSTEISARHERLLKERLNQIRLDLEISRYESLLKEKAKRIRSLEKRLGKVSSPAVHSIE